MRGWPRGAAGAALAGEGQGRDPGPSRVFSTAYGIAIQGDGKIVLVGESLDGDLLNHMEQFPLASLALVAVYLLVLFGARMWGQQ